MPKHRTIHVMHRSKGAHRQKRHRKTSQIIPVRNSEPWNKDDTSSLSPMNYFKERLPYSFDAQWLTAAKMPTNDSNRPGQSFSISSMNINSYKSSTEMLVEKPEESDTDRREKSLIFWINIVGIISVLFLVGLTIAVCVLLNLNSATTINTTGTIITTTTTSISLLWNSTGITVAGVTSSSGVATNKLNSPYGISLVSPNSLYITDESNNRVQKWLVGTSSGSTVAGLENGTSGPLIFNSTILFNPRDIAVDSSGNLYIVDTSWNRVLYWPNGASTGITVAGQGGFGTGNNQFWNPSGIAHDPSSGTIYIADSANNRVMQYLSGASSGTVVAGGYGAGTNSSQLNLPTGLHFDSSSNSLVIANSGAHNIVRWVLGASSWTLVVGSATGSSGTTSTLLSNPMDVTLDSMSNVYVADTANHRIQFFLAGQSNGTTIAGITGTTGSTSNVLNGPYSVTLDSQLNVYVADHNNFRVQEFIRY